MIKPQITGYSVKIPNCDTIQEFIDKLYCGNDLVSISKRYPKDYLNLPARAGHLNSIDIFDAMFFKYNKKQAEDLDIQTRLLLECTYEAFQDANLSMDILNNSNTGVYIGMCFSDFHTFALKKEKITGYENLGGAHTMTANKISFFFNLKGPSLAIDTACSSSLVAFDRAMQDLELGIIDRAVIGGVSLNLRPQMSKSFLEYNMLSPTGTCASFDINANGYCRSEGIGVVILEKSSLSKGKGYIQIMASGNNSDGFTSKGITFPNVDAQTLLATEVLNKSKINKQDIEYIETHGTGTIAGDNVEITALNDVYSLENKCIKIGSIKSNMGHAEGASGIMSLIKLLLMYEKKEIPPNLHFKETTHLPILENKFSVVTKRQKWNLGYSVINNFGFGGSNAHVIVGKGDKKYIFSKNLKKAYVYGRTEETVQNLPLTQYFEQRLSNKQLYNVRGVVNRRGTIINKLIKKKPNVVFAFSGQGSNWLGMGKNLLLNNNIFKDTINRLNNYLPYDINLLNLYEDGTHWYDGYYSTIGICSLEIGLVNILKEKNIIPDKILGHSMGEISASFMDKSLTEKECMEACFIRAKLSIKAKEQKYKGKMVVIGMKADVLTNIIKELDCNLTNIGCYNSPDGLVLSGIEDEIDKICQSLDKNTFIRFFDTDGIAYHSKLFLPFEEYILKELSSVITNSKKWSDKFISTSNPANKYCNAIYHCDNITKPVLFYQALEQLEENSVIIEIGPHSVLRTHVKRTRSDLNYIPTMLKDIGFDLDKLLDNLWLYDIDFDIDQIEGTLPLNERHNITWNHETKYYVPTYKDFENQSQKTIIKYFLDEDDSFLKDHCIKGKSIFPAMGHIYSIWKILKFKFPISFKNVEILKAVFLEGKNELNFVIERNENKWSVLFENDVVCRGEICNHNINKFTSKTEQYNIHKSDFYNYVGRFGYNYQNTFQIIENQSWNGTHTVFNKPHHWITYLDGMLQVTLNNLNALELPTFIGRVDINVNDLNLVEKDIYYNNFTKSISNTSVNIYDLRTTPTSSNPIDKINILANNFFKYGENKKNTDAINLLIQIIKQNLKNLNIYEFGYGMTECIYPYITLNMIKYVYSNSNPLPFTLLKDDNRFQINNKEIFDIREQFNMICISNPIFNDMNIILNDCNILLESGGFILLDTKLEFISIEEILTVLQNNQFIPISWFNNECNISLLARKRIEIKHTIINSSWKNVEQYSILKNEKPNDGILGFTRALAKENINVLGYYSPEGNPELIGLEKGMQNNYILNGTHGIMLETNFQNDSNKINALKCEYHLDIIKPGSLDTLKWIKHKQKEINVVYSGLNFKDVMLSFRKLILPKENINLGLEFSGWYKDKKVMGFGKNCLANTVNSDLIWEIPKYISLEEAATIPIVYATVYYALIERANIQKGQSILIHSASGGIGHAALNICLNKNCDIYVTCSDKKIKYLHETFGIPYNRIGNSRDNSFYQWIMEETYGEGVDIVLNSLSDEKLQLSLQCVKKYGHFCEIGKFDILQNSKIGMAVFNNNISIHGIDLSDMLLNPDKIKVLYNLVQMGLDTEEIKPLPYKIYNNDQIEDALRFMSGGKHIGKIIINMENNISEITQKYLTSGTHIITGGLGGFGLELALWLSKLGAEQIILTSRSGIKTGWQTKRIDQINNFLPCKVIISTLDVVKANECDQLIEQYKNIKGIWHSAMVLNDIMYENMTEEKWNETVNIKVLGLENLDKASQKFKLELDTFMAFSSVSSLHGNAGQTNYAWANNAMEEICRRRHNKNLPSLCVQWGPILNAGFLGHVDQKYFSNIKSNYEFQNIDGCLETLHDILFSKDPVVACYNENKIKNKETNNNKPLIDILLNLLGLKKTDINSYDNLTDLGIDSLQTTEVQNILENKGIHKTAEEIEQLTIKEIEQY